MELETAIRTRRTIKLFTPEPIGNDVLRELVALAGWAPNHHLTRPWRFHHIGPETLEQLVTIADSEKPGSGFKLRRAPTLLAVTSASTADADQREQAEDLHATAIAAYIVLLAAHGRGFAGQWRSPGVTASPAGRAAIGMTKAEVPVGILYLGTARSDRALPTRAEVSPQLIVTR